MTEAAASGPAVQQLEATLYKGTTLPHIVVKRRCVLQGEGAARRHRAPPKGSPPSAAVPRATYSPAAAAAAATHP
jgi:hypothetical protein